MTRYLLDTNVISELIRNPQGTVAERIARVGEDNICTSIIVAAELRYGAIKKGSTRLTAQLDSVLDALKLLPLEAPAERAYGELRTLLEAAGTPIGANDMLIAAHALTLNCILVTDKEREFSRIPDLQIENWLRQT